MTELLNNAWLGWQSFTDAGKLAALLAASLIFLWISYRKVTQKTLLVYTTLTAACCVIPVTAAGLMLYQTKFYDYQWIWSLVPTTAVIAYGAVCFLNECWPGFRASEWKRGVPVLALLLAVLLLGSGLGKTSADGGEDAQRRAAESILSQVRAEMQGEPICLWAPEEILEYARETDASIGLLYGRNMWDEWLNAYAYDTYPDDIILLYQWMEETAALGHAEGAAEQVETALGAGANCVLLPGNLDERVVKRLERVLNVRTVRLDGYYLLIV